MPSECAKSLKSPDAGVTSTRPAGPQITLNGWWVGEGVGLTGGGRGPRLPAKVDPDEGGFVGRPPFKPMSGPACQGPPRTLRFPIYAAAVGGATGSVFRPGPVDWFSPQGLWPGHRSSSVTSSPGRSGAGCGAKALGFRAVGMEGLSRKDGVPARHRCPGSGQVATFALFPRGVCWCRIADSVS